MKRKLNSLIGQLQHAINAIKPGYEMRMTVLVKLAKKPWHHICINVSFKADLLWWNTFLQTLNGISMMSVLVGVDKVGIDKVGIDKLGINQ